MGREGGGSTCQFTPGGGTIDRCAARMRGGGEEVGGTVTKCSPSEPPHIASGHGEATALMEAG